ncbi:hypothetical protein AURDEDRAFT_116003 [Auricularia subglabra TFB-10046 SS5]|nr:hypothetical protein AURDEDRAFT_116003 [Auricularia subglabra TFB-10046 SS5]
MLAVDEFAVRYDGSIAQAAMDVVLRADAPKLVSLIIEARVEGSPGFHTFLPRSPLDRICTSPALLARWWAHDVSSPTWREIKTFAAVYWTGDVSISVDDLSQILPQLRRAYLDFRVLHVAPPTHTTPQLVWQRLTVHHEGDASALRNADSALRRIAPLMNQDVTIFAPTPEMVTAVRERMPTAPSGIVIFSTIVDKSRQLALLWHGDKRVLYCRQTSTSVLSAVLRDDFLQTVPVLTTWNCMRMGDYVRLTRQSRALNVVDLTLYVLDHASESRYKGTSGETSINILTNRSNAMWHCPRLQVLRITSRLPLSTLPAASGTPQISIPDVVHFVEHGMGRLGAPIACLVLEGVALQEADQELQSRLRRLATQLIVQP